MDIQKNWAEDLSQSIYEISLSLFKYVKFGTIDSAGNNMICEIDNLYYDMINDLNSSQELKEKTKILYDDKISYLKGAIERDDRNRVGKWDKRIVSFEHVIDRKFLGYIIYKYARDDDAHKNKNVFLEEGIEDYDNE